MNRLQPAIRVVLPLIIRLSIALILLTALSGPNLSAPVELAVRGDYAASFRFRPSDRALLDRWIVSALDNGQGEEAEALIRLVASQHGWTAALQSQLNRAIALHDPDQVTRLIQISTPSAPDAALSTNPADIQQLRARGADLIAQEQYAAAEAVFNRLVALDGGVPGSMALLALAQEGQGRDGWPLLTLALALAPQDTTVNYVVALHWRRRGELDKALAALGAASQQDTANPAVAAEIGGIYRLRGNVDEAARWLERAVSLDPTEIGFHRALCAFYADQAFRLESDGLLAIRRALLRFQNDAELTALYGQILLMTPQTAPITGPGPAAPQNTNPRDEAHLAFERALTLDARNVRARFYLGRVLEQFGAMTEAQAAYRQVIGDAPDSPFAELAARALERF